MNEPVSRLPIVLFVITLAGVAVLYWHSKNFERTQRRQIAAAQELQTNQLKVQQKINVLEREQPLAKIEYDEIKLPLPRIRSHPSALSQPAPVFSAGSTIETTLHTVQIPTRVQTGVSDSPAAREVAAASRDLSAATDAVVAAETSGPPVPSASGSTVVGSASPAHDQVLGVSREVVTLGFSVIILGASLFIILNKKFPPGTEKWAFASVGTILGHWFG